MENQKITHQDLLEAGLTPEMIDAIAFQLEAVMNTLRLVESQIGENLKYKLLTPDATHPTLWCQFYELSKLFKNQ